MTIEQKRRELFEARFPIPDSVWWHDVQHSYVGLTGNAPWWLYQDRFESWNAALDAVVIDLPQEDERGRITLTGAVRSIESTGLGLKVLP